MTHYGEGILSFPPPESNYSDPRWRSGTRVTPSGFHTIYKGFLPLGHRVLITRVSCSHRASLAEKEVNYEAIPPRNSEKAPKKFRCPETAAGGGPTTQGRRQRRRAQRNHFLNSETPCPPRRLLHETGTGGPVHSGVIYCALRQVPRPGPVTFQYYIGPQKGAFARGSLITRVPGHALFDALWARDSLISAAGV